MVILKKIINAICDPFRKIVSHIDTDQVSKFFHRHPFIIYVASLAIAILIFVLAYFVIK